MVVRGGRDRDCTQDVPTPWNPVSQEFEECGWQYVGARCHATTEHLTTIGLGVWFELQVSVRYSASHYTVHCLLLCTFPDNVPVLPLVSPRKLWASLFPQKVDSWIFSSLVILDVSVPWSGVCFPVQNDGPTFCPQWLFGLCAAWFSVGFMN